MNDIEIGRRLKKVRNYRGRLQEEVGPVVNGGQSKISNIERGEATLCTADLVKLSEFLDFSIDVFVREGPFDLTACLRGKDSDGGAQRR